MCRHQFVEVPCKSFSARVNKRDYILTAEANSELTAYTLQMNDDQSCHTVATKPGLSTFSSPSLQSTDI